jgi:hypothetical protein
VIPTHDREGFFDETPVADAVEQEQQTTLESTPTPMTIAKSTGNSEPVGV